jgi:hypothetical protein
MNALIIIGLVVGVVILLVVIFLLQSTLNPLRAVLKDVELAKTAPMLTRGVPGTDQLDQTRRLAQTVPPLALAYLAKLGAAPAAPAAPSFPSTAAPSAYPQAPGAHEPAWKRFQSGIGR